jgi:ribosomal protein S18 acetylase RimI-like enzyme
MDVRKATPADAEAIRDIARRSMEASYSLSPSAIDTAVRKWYSDEELVEKFDDEELFVLVVESEDGVLGFSESTVVGDQGDVLWLHVDPMYRGEGVGTRLFERTGELLSERGAESLRGRVLADNEQGNTFYEDHGLVRTGEGRVEIDDTPYVENIYPERVADDLERTSGPEGERLYVDHADSDRGSKGPFHVVWMDRDREEAYGYFCDNCESLVTSMDAMGGMECNVCGNHRKPTRWDAAYM